MEQNLLPFYLKMKNLQLKENGKKLTSNYTSGRYERLISFGTFNSKKKARKLKKKQWEYAMRLYIDDFPIEEIQSINRSYRQKCNFNFRYSYFHFGITYIQALKSGIAFSFRVNDLFNFKLSQTITTLLKKLYLSFLQLSRHQQRGSFVSRSLIIDMHKCLLLLSPP